MNYEWQHINIVEKIVFIQPSFIVFSLDKNLFD